VSFEFKLWPDRLEHRLAIPRSAGEWIYLIQFESYPILPQKLQKVVAAIEDLLLLMF
jgi:hypothetical protein